MTSSLISALGLMLDSLATEPAARASGIAASMTSITNAMPRFIQLLNSLLILIFNFSFPPRYLKMFNFQLGRCQNKAAFGSINDFKLYSAVVLCSAAIAIHLYHITGYDQKFT
jgi:hypothetical protein